MRGMLIGGSLGTVCSFLTAHYLIPVETYVWPLLFIIGAAFGWGGSQIGAQIALRRWDEDHGGHPHGIHDDDGEQT